MYVKTYRNVSCAECGVEFSCSDSRQRFCSPTCRYNYNSKVYFEKHKNTRKYYLNRLAYKGNRPQITSEYLEELFQKQQGKCALSGVDLTWTTGHGRRATNISLDRIRPGQEYSPDNVRLVCLAVNIMRSDMVDENFLPWIERIHQHSIKQSSISIDLDNLDTQPLWQGK